MTVTSEDTSYIKEQITSGNAEGAFVMTCPTSYTYYVNNLSMYDAKEPEIGTLFGYFKYWKTTAVARPSYFALRKDNINPIIYSSIIRVANFPAK